MKTIFVEDAESSETFHVIAYPDELDVDVYYLLFDKESYIYYAAGRGSKALYLFSFLIL